MQKPFRILVALALIGLGVWGWRVLFPSAERVIRNRLGELATVASFQANEGPLAKAYNASKLSSYFTQDVSITADIPGRGTQTLNGSDNLVQAAMAMRAGQNMSSLKVEFLDINVVLGPDRQTAVANLTAKATINGDRDFSVQEFNFMLRKVDGKWRIHRVESVKTLTLGGPGARGGVPGVRCEVSGRLHILSPFT